MAPAEHCQRVLLDQWASLLTQDGDGWGWYLYRNTLCLSAQVGTSVQTGSLSWRWNLSTVTSCLLLSCKYSSIFVDIRITLSGPCVIIGPHHEKTCQWHIWTTKVQISLHIRTVWSVPLLFAAYTVYSCTPDKVLHDFHQYWQILSYIPVTHKHMVAGTVMCRQDGRGWFPVLLDDLSKCRTNSQRKSQLS